MAETGGANVARNDFYRHKDLTSDYYQTIIQKSRPVWCRILWGVIILACLLFTGFMVYKLLYNFFQYKSFNQSSDVWKSGVALPAMTICNMNVVNWTQWGETIDDEFEQDLNWFLKTVSADMKDGWEMSEEDIERADKLDKVIIDGQQVNILADFYSHFQEFLLGNGITHPYMEFAGKWLELPENSYFKTELGDCLVLNDDQALVQKLGGVKGGFSIDLNTRLQDYLYSTKTTGFMLYLRNPHEILLSDKGGIRLSPGHEIFVKLTRQNIKRLGTPYGTCKTAFSQFNKTSTLTQRECVQMLYLSEALRICQCFPWYMIEAIKYYFSSNPEHYETWLTANNHSIETYALDKIESKMCGFVQQVTCDIKVVENLTGMDIQDVCQEPCAYNAWEYSINTGKFPGTMGYFKDFLLGEVTMNFDDENSQDENSQDENSQDETAYEYAEENFVRLYVYYDDVKVTEIEQTKAYEFYNFIAELGGTTDLLIGISFFTLFQLFEIFIGLTIFKCCSRKNEQCNVNRSAEDIFPNPDGAS